MSGGRILVVGGGITGLTLCHELGRRAPAASLVLCEKTQRLGGWIRTEHDPASGHRYETGPRSLNRIRGNMTLQLCDRMGLSDMIVPASAESNTRFVIGRDGRMHPLPHSLLGVFQSPLTRSIPYWLVRDAVRPSSISDRDISIDEFFRARIGPEGADLLASALTVGIYAGDSKRLSMQSCLPSLIEMTDEHKSLARGLVSASMMKPSPPPSLQESPHWSQMQTRLGKAPMYSFNGGLSTLTDALAKTLHDSATVNTNVKVKTLCPRTLNVTFDDGRREQFDRVFWTGSTSSLASALQPLDDSVQALRAALRTVHYATVAVVTLAWNRPVQIPEGFGVLVPACINNVPPILGITFDNRTFPTQFSPGTTNLTVMIGGDRNPELLKGTKSDLGEIAMEAVRQIIGVSTPPDFTAVNIGNEAIPQFYVGHRKLVGEILHRSASFHPGFRIMGTAISGVSINDCIRSAYEEAARFVDAEDEDQSAPIKATFATTVQ